MLERGAAFNAMLVPLYKDLSEEEDSVFLARELSLGDSLVYLLRSS